MKKKKKDFDCVEFQHEAGRRIMEKLKGLTREQELDYWNRAYEKMLRRKKRQLKKNAES